jgi:hypothetical protein
MRNRLYIAIMLAGVSSLSVHAQKASFNGTWKLNVPKSFMGMDHPFRDYELTKKIEVKGDAILIIDTAVHNSVMNTPLPDSTTTMELAEDGKEHDVQLPPAFPGTPPIKVRVTAEWQGCTLELVEAASGPASYSRHRLFLSEGGSQLIVLVEQHSAFGDSEQRLVFEKTP